jgi:diguanylate cyclase (GGDEF)-like protein
MTLRSKVALILVAAIFALLAVATLLRAMEQQRAFMVERTEQGITLAQALAELVMKEAAGLGDPRVQALVEEYGTTVGVIGIRVVDEHQSVVAASDREEIGRVYRGPNVTEAVRHGELSTEVTPSRRSALAVALPLRAPGGRLAGALELQMDLRGRTSDLRTFVRQGVLAAALIAAVTTLLLIWILTFVVVRPVTHYARVTQDLARGEFGVDIPVRGSDEIGQLGRALARTRDSLRELSAIWKDQNPLTGLPGNRAIERELRRRLDAGEAFVVLYADLDAFKSYNDRYGFDRGDHVLRFTARSLQDAAGGTPGAFVGHVGGDDFVLAVPPASAEEIARDAIRRFDADVATFYDAEDRQRGYVTGHDRQGKETRTGITALTVVGVPVAARLASPLRIGEVAAELKAAAKQIPGSTFLMDRRSAR